MGHVHWVQSFFWITFITYPKKKMYRCLGAWFENLINFRKKKLFICLNLCLVAESVDKMDGEWKVEVLCFILLWVFWEEGEKLNRNILLLLKCRYVRLSWKGIDLFYISINVWLSRNWREEVIKGNACIGLYHVVVLWVGFV